jgi:hypothetical protein
VTVVETFRMAAAASTAQLPGVELLPERLARACAQVLPVDGAGIALFFAEDRRLPLGGSDPMASAAERLQFTAGEGPCLTSHAEGRPVVADEAGIRARWPAFYDSLVSHTPFREALSLPLAGGMRGIGALDLYFVPPNNVGSVSLPNALLISEEVAAALGDSNRRAHGGSNVPAWVDAPAAARRSMVWQAMGFLNAGLRVTSADALAILRAHAFADGQDLDDLAAQVVNRQVPVEAFSLGRDSLR